MSRPQSITPHIARNAGPGDASVARTLKEVRAPGVRPRSVKSL